jgi:alpha-mannosidase
MESFEPGPVKLMAEPRGRDAVLRLDDTEIAVSIEDRGDVGDLYTFAPDGDPVSADVSVADAARFSSERSDVSVSAWRVPGEDFLRIHVEVENRAPDHRLRLLIALPETATSSTAGAPFEVVHRTLESEGGVSEPPSRCWPARGFAFAGGRGVLAEGVFEYEVTDRHLAITLMRCTGNISRGPLEVRSEVAGPDVPTPGAQLLGRHSFDFGLTLMADGVEAVRLWEGFALEPLVTAALGEGRLPARGSLLDLDAPALSSVRRIAGEVVATVWNPSRETLPVKVGEVEIELGPHRIEKVIVPDPRFA